MFRLSALFPLVLVVACTGAPTPTPSAPATDAPAADEPPLLPILAEAKAGVSDPALADLLVRHWDDTMTRAPTWATSLGDHRFDDRLSDPAGREAAEAATRAFLAEAQSLDVAAMNDADRLTRELFIESLTHSVADDVCRWERWSVSPRYNVYTQYADMHESLPVTDAERAAAQLARVKQIPAHVDQDIADLRAGLAEGLVANAASVQKMITQLDAELAKPTDEWPHMQLAATATAPDAVKEAFKDDLGLALEGELRPAIVRLRDLLRDEILPAARPAGKEGLSALPLGKDCYAALVGRYTTLPSATAAERHQAGLDALEGIHAEFREIGGRAFGTQDLAAIFERLRTDPALRFTTEEEVEGAAKAALARAREAMPSAFGRLPQAPCTVVRIPEHEAPYTTIAYYKRPEAEQGGRYFINTYKPETRPRHEAAVLAYHESIPGHHLQIAIAQELPDMPAFRRYEGMTAFVEGWALYTERLSDEMGLYDGDIDRLGMLSFDAWRAARLVVDTGIHDQGWSREQAETFLAENTPLAMNNIANEVDRYITTPGQALAYKTGQQEIWALRRGAEAKLGDRFDLKAFHDVVLGAGAVSLPVLRRRVEAWVASQE